MKYLQFLIFVNSLPQWIQFPIIHYAKTGKRYGSIVIDIDYIPQLKGVEKKLSEYGLKAKFIRINPNVEQDDRGGTDYTHFVLHLEELK